jgi:hypothetical protein
MTRKTTNNDKIAKLEKLNADMAQLIQTQQAIIDKTLKTLELSYGGKIYLSRIFYDISHQYACLLFVMLNSEKIPDDAPEEKRISHETALKEAEQRIEAVSKSKADAYKEWIDFIGKHPAAARNLYGRAGPEMKIPEV